MNIVICIKQTVNTESEVTIGSDGALCFNDPKYSINPHDEYAIEEAVRLKEDHGAEVCVVTLGDSRAQEILRTAMAMGVDRALHITVDNANSLDEWSTAKILAQAINDHCFEEPSVDLVIAGKVSSDRGAGQIAYRLAEELGFPAISGAFSISMDDQGAIRAVCDIDGKQKTIKVALPAVLIAQKGLNEPRFVPFSGLMKAKKKPLTTITLNDLGISDDDLQPKTKVTQRVFPPKRKAGVLLEGEARLVSAELAKLLREEESII